MVEPGDVASSGDWLRSSDTAQRLGITPRHFRRALRDQLDAAGVPCLRVGKARHWHFPSVVRALRPAEVVQ